MGKDDKQRRKGTSASSSKAAELLQSSNQSIQFLKIGNDPSSLTFPDIDDTTNDEFGNVEPEWRIAFSKITKREAKTREKGLKTLTELVRNCDPCSLGVINGIAHFVKFYNYLVFDGVSTVRSAANETLATAISKLRKQIIEQIVKMLPFTLLSMYDPVSTVRKSATDLLNNCFDDNQRKKINDRAASKSVKVCLQIIQKRHNLVKKQKYEDIETLEQRSDRIIIQAFATLSDLSGNCPELVHEVFDTIDNIYDSIVTGNDQILNSMLMCIVKMLNNSQINGFMQTNACFKILKLLDSEDEKLSKNAFGCYLFMAEAIASGKVETQLTKKDFIDDLVLRMVLFSHFNALQEFLLPLMIISIKYEKNGTMHEWVIDVLESFFEGEVDMDLYLVWSKTFVDVSDWLYKSFLTANSVDEFGEQLASTTLKFVQSYVDRQDELPAEMQSTFQKLFGDFIVHHLLGGADKENKLAESLSSLLIDNLPSTASTILLVLSSFSVHPKQQRQFLDALAARVIINDKAPNSLFQQLIRLGVYIDNPQLNDKLLADKLVEVLQSGEVTDDHLKCFKYLKKGGACNRYNLTEMIDMNSANHLSSVIKIFSDSTELFSCEERLQLVNLYISSFTNEHSTVENPWTDECLAWIEQFDAAKVCLLVVELHKKLSLRLYVTLILALDSSKRNEMAVLILQRLFTFDQTVDRANYASLNRFLKDTNVDLKPFAVEFLKQLKSAESCDLAKWFAMGSSLSNLPYVANSLDLSTDAFDDLTLFLDSTFAEEILLNEQMLVVSALSAIDYQAFDVDRCGVMIWLANLAAFYMALNVENVSIQLKICLCYTMLKQYVSGLIIQNELCRQLDLLVQYWTETVKTWSMTKVCERIIYYLVDSNKEIPFTVLFTLRKLKTEFDVDNLADAFAISVLENTQKLRAIAAVSFNLPFELFPENDYLYFVNSLEKTSEKLKAQEDQVDIALIIITDLRDKIEADDFSGLFSLSENEPIKNALSCALMRISALISRALVDVESPLRDFVLCGLITAAENFSTSFRCCGLVRLLATFAVKFFIYYDRNLKSLLAISRSASDASAEEVERRTKVESIRYEWREFFGASMANYLIAWFCWSSFTETNQTERFPEFFRTQICKFIYNTDPDVELFKFVQIPTPELFGQIRSGRNIDTKDIFDMLVELLFSPHPELQLTSVHILRSELITILCAKSDAIDEDTKMILALRDGENADEETQTTSGSSKDIEYKLLEFFSSLIERLKNVEWNDPNSLDPWLAVVDLLLQVVRYLDSQVAATFCSQLQGEVIYTMLFKLCSYINFNEDAKIVKKFARLEPATFFTLWNSELVLEDKDQLAERLISIEGYTIWLYRRALETLPSVVREWFNKMNDKCLKSFTQSNLSPIIIEKELSSIDPKLSDDRFSLRARPNTREILVKYKVEDVTLELMLTLPENYPLSQITIEHEKRKILTVGLTKMLHKNLFAFVNNRNGSLLEGINQWRKSVERRVEGVEPCSICLMIVSSSDYQMPNVKCRTCLKKFHSGCILKWIKTSAKPSCPLCRTNFH